MSGKTEIHAEDGRHDLVVTRTFELPVERLFRAYADPELLAQWMGTRVIKLANEAPGAYAFQTVDGAGATVFRAHGTIHTFAPPRQIVRTFEMTSAGFAPQLEFLDFEAVSPTTSRLRMQIVFRSPEDREKQLRLPFAYGLGMAHDRLEQLLNSAS